MVQNTTGIFGNGASGFLGLGRSSGSASYISGMLQGRGWKNTTLGLALNTFNGSSSSGQSAGSLTVQELDPNQYTGQVHWQPLAQVTDVPANTPADWALKFDSNKLTFGSQSASSSSGGQAIIDPYFSEIRIPSSDATDFCSSISISFLLRNSIV